MAKYHPVLASAGWVAVVVALAGSAGASEFRCQRGDDAIRRVEIATEQPGQSVPCEVVYWKDTELPGVRTVLWNAQTDPNYCAQKAQELVDTLQAGGWICAPAPGDDGTEAAAVEPAPSPDERPVARASEPDSAPRTTPEAAPETAPEPPDAPAAAAALTPEEPVPSPGEAADVADRTALDAIIEQNLVHLNDGVEGRFAAEIGRYGDLNDDGLEDGLVFFTYQSERLGQARFIAVYLYDGESYTLAATKPVSGSEDQIHSAEVEAIEDGAVSLRLNVLEPGDAACCPSGARHQTLVLRDGQLIEIKPAANSTGRS